ncbi:MAG: hypothetical protein V3V41_07905 [Candidatus Heimdallarchaeota archaeon]
MTDCECLKLRQDAILVKIDYEDLIREWKNKIIALEYESKTFCKDCLPCECPQPIFRTGIPNHSLDCRAKTKKALYEAKLAEEAKLEAERIEAEKDV